MQHRFNSFLQFLLAGLDILTLNLIVIVATYIFDRPIVNSFHVSGLQDVAILNILWICICIFGKVYSGQNILNFEAFSRSSMKAYVFWFGITCTIYLLSNHIELSARTLFVALSSFCIMLIVNRFIFLVCYQYFKSRHSIIRKVLILGYNENAKKLASYLEVEQMNTQVVGYCDNFENVFELSNYPILGTLDDVMKASKSHQVNEIFSTISPEKEPKVYNLMRMADDKCIRFKLVPDLSYFIKGNVHVGYLNDIPVLSLRSEPLDELTNRIIKRVFDFTVSLLILVFVLFWLIPLLALLIKIESKGPIFFIQERSGRDNKTFRCIKFRSMRVTDEANLKQATRNDIRLTKVGRILRKTNLDEFPQFINVLMGNMSLVGPRPHMLKHTSDYSQMIGRYMIRQFLKPGITGWAQVNGLRGETKSLFQMEQRVEHDIWYMENWSFWLDVRIMFLTFYSTIKGDDNAF